MEKLKSIYNFLLFSLIHFIAVKIPPKGPSPFFVSSTNEILFE